MNLPQFNKQTGYRAMGIALFIASGAVTIMYTLSNAIGFIPSTVAFIQGLGIEAAKSFFSYVFVTTETTKTKLENGKTKVDGYGKKTMFGILALIALVISIVATTGFNLNMTNTVKNYITKKSDEYKNKQKFVNTQGDLYEETKKSIDDLKSQRDKAVADGEKIRDQWGKNYKTQKSIEQAKIDNTKADYNSQIAQKEKELDKYASNVNQKTGEIIQTEGYEALYTTLAKFINENNSEDEKKPTTSDAIAFYISLIISVALEFFGIGFIYLSLEEEKKNFSTPIDPNKKKKPEIDTLPKQTEQPKQIEAGRLQGMKLNNEGSVHMDKSSTPPKKVYKIKIKKAEQAKTNVVEFKNKSSVHVDKSPQICINTKVERSFTDDDVRRYLEVMYRTQSKSGNSIGFRQIGNQIGIDAKTAEKIKGYLETIGIVKSLNGRTRILKEEA